MAGYFRVRRVLAVHIPVQPVNGHTDVPFVLGDFRGVLSEIAEAQLLAVDAKLPERIGGNRHNRSRISADLTSSAR
ncbi:hypothetical protein M3148_05750 [Georgenia satyanarayanai]|uniref:hypothetical protein n=1 Tax=Georgenia satyanarayanai TaxID=860221 RepID=UPI0020401036|nr:hypothetical protein [Georgenia satyanarayanai]MCM3660499.1 hypothetical protein [Georgenia satyanarayanai]